MSTFWGEDQDPESIIETIMNDHNIIFFHNFIFQIKIYG